MNGRDDAYVRPDHHIATNIESADVIKGAVLIDENVTTDADIDRAGGVERLRGRNFPSTLRLTLR
jgi:hypothetical protein